VPAAEWLEWHNDLADEGVHGPSRRCCIGGGGVQTEGHQGPSDWCGAVAERTKGQGVGGRSHKGLVRGGDSCLRDKRVNISKEENEGGGLCCGFSVNS
jgi:hypothetical protein